MKTKFQQVFNRARRPRQARRSRRNPVPLSRARLRERGLLKNKQSLNRQ